MHISITPLTTGVGVIEVHRDPKNVVEHSIVEHPGGIDADNIEQSTFQQIHHNTDYHQGGINGQTFGIRERTGESVRHGYVCLSETAAIHWKIYHCSVDTTLRAACPIDVTGMPKKF